MRLSVLIPTYNCDCRRLVRQLQLQLPPDGELIVGDDCSTDADLRQQNSEIESLPGCRIFWAKHNIGRAAIRNALAREAKGEWLLFIDADAEVRSSSFIADYLSAVTSPEGSVDVVCGGTGNLSECPNPSVRLRYDYEVQAEKRLTLPYRRRFPYDQFTTFNFLIRRLPRIRLRGCHLRPGTEEKGHPHPAHREQTDTPRAGRCSRVPLKD